MKTYTVIDTNVIVSSMLTGNPTSPTKWILSKIREKNIIPIINADILEEYADVLSRDKFHFLQEDIDNMLQLFRTRGIVYTPECLRQDFIDLNDVIFYETYRLKEDSYLVTGNLRHFPSEPRIVPPADMMSILLLSEESSGNLLSEPVSIYITDDMKRAWEAVERMHATAVANGIADMSMEEIDEEIRLYREERRKKRNA